MPACRRGCQDRTGGHHRRHDVAANSEVCKGVVAVSIGLLGKLSGFESSIRVRVKEHRLADNTVFATVESLLTIAVGVSEDAAMNGHGDKELNGSDVGLCSTNRIAVLRARDAALIGQWTQGIVCGVDRETCR